MNILSGWVQKEIKKCRRIVLGRSKTRVYDIETRKYANWRREFQEFPSKIKGWYPSLIVISQTQNRKIEDFLAYKKRPRVVSLQPLPRWAK